MSSALDRQIKPIYDALETHSNKSAVVQCNKVLKKHPNNILVKALKALALVRQQKVEESLVLADEILALKPTDDAVLTAMMHVLRGLGRHSDIIAMFENAYKQNPLNEDLGTQTFFANVRVGNWKAAQQIAGKMHKQFHDDRYLYWNVYSAVLQANDPSTEAALRPVLLKLALRLISQCQTPSFYSTDRFYVHVLILRDLQLYDEAFALLNDEIGKRICAISLACDELRREIAKLRGAVKDEGDHARERILEKQDRNWLEFLSVLDATFWDISSTSEPSEEAIATVKEQIVKSRELFTQVGKEDGLKDRSGPLALLELAKRARVYGLSSDASELRTLVESYFSQFGDKACCYEDLVPYVDFEGEEFSKWTSFLNTQKQPADTTPGLRRLINVFKLQRYNLTSGELTPELETERAAEYVRQYLSGLALGSNLPDTELQPADDLAILAGHAYITLWKLTGEESHLHTAASLLDYASSRSRQSYQIRLLLIRIFQLLGAPSLALEQYRLMNVKQVQTDTLSHLILTRASMWSLAPLGDITYMSECMEASQIYMSNSQETAEFVARAFSTEKYSQIADFIVFEDRLDNSLQRDLMKIEHVRMRVANEQLNADLVDMELIELKFIFDRLHHDNRDFTVIPNYQPRGQPSLNEITLPVKMSPGMGWLSAYLKIYIKGFQLASDLDDTVEDKLLIGDRPKPSADPENQAPLNERLAIRKQEEIDDMTPEEQLFYEYASALSGWLAPYHDHVRPPPAALLAEAAKANDLKPGHPLKNLAAAQAANGSTTNGQSKKDDEPPAIKEPPELISKVFDELKARFDAEMNGQKLPSELLHIASITQEAFLFFALETVRFKQASVVKIHKLGNLVQSFKSIRERGQEVLTQMADELSKLAEQVATPEGRHKFVQASSSIQTDTGFHHDYVLNVAKKVTDSRKQTFEGISKGIRKVIKNHS
ncbi:actin cytoskeleton organization protein [Panus rudis PR-1116 ss-1]|nr:actin cytoskeleton organization protein [Panus rudis PR-1116 ss-1]